MTEDKFIFAMGGHSSAAGHGNHFTQSYTLQVQWILEEPVQRCSFLGIFSSVSAFGSGKEPSHSDGKNTGRRN